jgi:hypothetical protein
VEDRPPVSVDCWEIAFRYVALGFPHAAFLSWKSSCGRLCWVEFSRSEIPAGATETLEKLVVWPFEKPCGIIVLEGVKHGG